MELFGTTVAKIIEELSTRGAMVLTWQFVLLGAAMTAAFFTHRAYIKSLDVRMQRDDLSVWRGMLMQVGQRLALPLSLLAAVLVVRLGISQSGYETPLLDLLVKLMLALASVRLIVYALRVGIAPGPALKAWEKIISTTIWGLVALHILDWLPALEATLDQVALTVGESRFSLLMALKLLVLCAFYVLLALWVSGVIEQRLNSAKTIGVSMRVGLAKVIKVGLLAVAFLMAMEEAGLNVASLTVFGGALGVGIGFGLQKIVSNFISGFILLGDRSIRPGDVITVGNTYGWVRQLRARYIVVCNRDGVETLIPNENLVTSEVINWSFTDKHVRVRIPVQISYNDDPEQAMALMEKAATANSRVLTSPAPAARLMAFADSGIALELRVWLVDPQEGIGNVRSDINLAIWRAFKAAGITIPYPQRDVHIIPPLPPGEGWGEGVEIR
jgi:small-conductance mechanosensitive channel